MSDERPRRRGHRLLALGAGILALLSVLAFLALELRLSGPLGLSGRLVYRSLRVLVRDATIPTPPRIDDLSNVGPNVVIIVLDCYRRDYLSNAAPRLREFADKAWQFDSYYTSAPWTKPSTVSLFTGLNVRRHFVIQGGGSQLPDDAVTLAEILQRQGFRTSGFVWNPHLTRRQAFDQGFDHYVDDARRGSKSLLYEFFSWLDRERPERFFAYIHFQGTHDPYYDDNDLEALLSAPPYPGGLDLTNTDYTHAVRKGRRLSAEEAAHLRHVAFGKARKVDRQAVGGFLDRFEGSRLAENTLLVITSDHGDAFFEHGSVSHGATVFNEEIHVPLVIRYPARFAREHAFEEAGRDSCIASTVDLLPTVLDFVGSPPAPGIDGMSLIPGRGREARCSRVVVSERTKEGQGIAGAALLSEKTKLMVDYEDGGRRLRLFDLGADPQEDLDLSGQRGAEAAALDADLANLLNEDGSSMANWSAREVEIPEEQVKALRELGYVE